MKHLIRIHQQKNFVAQLLAFSMNHNTPPHHIHLRPFFRDHPSEPVPEENFWTLWCKGRLTEADTLTIHLGTTPSGLTSAHLHHLPIFYRPDALLAAQPTVSKNWRHNNWTTTIKVKNKRNAICCIALTL